MKDRSRLSLKLCEISWRGPSELPTQNEQEEILRTQQRLLDEAIAASPTDGVVICDPAPIMTAVYTFSTSTTTRCSLQRSRGWGPRRKITNLGRVVLA